MAQSPSGPRRGCSLWKYTGKSEGLVLLGEPVRVGQRLRNGQSPHTSKGSSARGSRGHNPQADTEWKRSEDDVDGTGPFLVHAQNRLGTPLQPEEGTSNLKVSVKVRSHFYLLLRP